MEAEYFPDLTTKRLHLRQFTPEDLQNVYSGLSNPKVIKYYGISFKTLEATKEQLTWFGDLEKNGTGIWWAICDKKTNTFLGAGGLNNLDKKNRKAEIGFWLLPEHWGQGILSEAFPLIVEYAFEHLNLHRIEGFVESRNSNCKRAMTKVGFELEGTMRDCEVKNDVFISLDIYAKVRSFE